MTVARCAHHIFNEVRPAQSLEQRLDEFVLPAAQCQILTIGSLIDIEHGVTAMGALLHSIGRLITAEYRPQNIGTGSQHGFKHADIDKVAAASELSSVKRHQNTREGEVGGEHV